MGNPILNIDPRGDTTRVYSTEGDFIRSIDDSYENQEHFFSGRQLILLEALTAKVESEDRKAAIARRESRFFIGSTTRKELRDIQVDSENDEKERAFVFHYSTKNKELSLTDITSKLDSRGTNHAVYPSAGVIVDQVPSGTELVGTGHTHGIYGFRGMGGRDFTQRKPTTKGGYPDYWNHVDNSNMPLLLAAPTGYTIYSTKLKTYSDGVNRVNAPSNYGQHFNYHGLLIDWANSRI